MSFSPKAPAGLEIWRWRNEVLLTLPLLLHGQVPKSHTWAWGHTDRVHPAHGECQHCEGNGSCPPAAGEAALPTAAVRTSPRRIPQPRSRGPRRDARGTKLQAARAPAQRGGQEGTDPPRARAAARRDGLGPRPAPLTSPAPWPRCASRTACGRRHSPCLRQLMPQPLTPAGPAGLTPSSPLPLEPAERCHVDTAQQALPQLAVRSRPDT